MVWSRIDVEAIKAINLPHCKRKSTDISRQLYLEDGWAIPQGLIDKKERDRFKLSNAEWQNYRRDYGLDPKEIKILCQDAWALSDNLTSLKHALEEKTCFWLGVTGGVLLFWIKPKRFIPCPALAGLRVKTVCYGSIR